MYKALFSVGLPQPLYDVDGNPTGTYGSVLFFDEGQSYDLSDLPQPTLDGWVQEGFIEAVVSK